MTEEWKAVVGYEGWYEVSNLGGVRRIKMARGVRAIGTVLKRRACPCGYLSVTLTRDSKSKHFHAHKLVALAFIGPYPVGKEVNHKDGDRMNASVENLEYVTRSENVRHSVLVLRKMTHCPQGHPYAGANLLVEGSGRRRCRECRRQANARRDRSHGGRGGTPRGFLYPTTQERVEDILAGRTEPAGGWPTRWTNVRKRSVAP